MNMKISKFHIWQTVR